MSKNVKKSGIWLYTGLLSAAIAVNAFLVILAIGG